MLHVVSLDIIVDRVYSNILDPEIRRFWIEGAKRKWVFGFVAGPPCETWSQARAHELDQDGSKRGKGPGVIRTGEYPWGLIALGVKEVGQILFGDILMGFALVMPSRTSPTSRYIDCCRVILVPPAVSRRNCYPFVHQLWLGGWLRVLSPVVHRWAPRWAWTVRETSGPQNWRSTHLVFAMPWHVPFLTAWIASRWHKVRTHQVISWVCAKLWKPRCTAIRWVTTTCDGTRHAMLNSMQVAADASSRQVSKKKYVHHHVYLCIFIYHVTGQIIADQFLTIWPDSQPGKTAPQPEVSYLQPSKDDGGTCAVQTNSFIIHQTGRKYGEDRNFVKFVEMYQVQIWRCFQFSVFLVSRVVLIRVPSDMLQTLGDRCCTCRAQTLGVPTHGTNGLQPLGPQPSQPA